MRRATEADTERLAGELESAAQLLRMKAECKCFEYSKNDAGEIVPVPACRTRVDHALRVARQAAGFMGSSGGPSRGSDVANPTLAAIIDYRGNVKGHHGPEWWQHRIGRDTGLIGGALADLLVIVAELGRVTKTKPGDLRKNGQGVCPICDHFCSGAVNDRLVAGFCDTDYRAWRRAGTPDRFYFTHERRRDRADGAA